jgi:hypothetical protein
MVGSLRMLSSAPACSVIRREYALRSTLCRFTSLARKNNISAEFKHRLSCAYVKPQSSHRSAQAAFAIRFRSLASASPETKSPSPAEDVEKDKILKAPLGQTSASSEVPARCGEWCFVVSDGHRIGEFETLSQSRYEVQN